MHWNKAFCAYENKISSYPALIETRLYSYAKSYCQLTKRPLKQRMTAHIQRTASGGRKLNYFKQTCQERPMFLNVVFDAFHRNSEWNKEVRRLPKFPVHVYKCMFRGKLLCIFDKRYRDYSCYIMLNGIKCTSFWYCWSRLHFIFQNMWSRIHHNQYWNFRTIYGGLGTKQE